MITKEEIHEAFAKIYEKWSYEYLCLEQKEEGTIHELLQDHCEHITIRKVHFLVSEDGKLTLWYRYYLSVMYQNIMKIQIDVEPGKLFDVMDGIMCAHQSKTLDVYCKINFGKYPKMDSDYEG